MPKNKRTIEMLKADYPEGCHIMLLKKIDEKAPPIGSMGTVKSVDGEGIIHVEWDNGRIRSTIDNISSIQRIR